MTTRLARSFSQPSSSQPDRQAALEKDAIADVVGADAGEDLRPVGHGQDLVAEVAVPRTAVVQRASGRTAGWWRETLGAMLAEWANETDLTPGASLGVVAT